MPHDDELWLFLDECLSSNAVAALRAFWKDDYPNLYIAHLAEHYDRGEDDDVWLNKLRSEPKWIVITCDHGRDPKKPKLPEICKAIGRTHIIISETIQRNEDIKSSLTALIRSLLVCPLLPRGSQLRLNLKTLKKTGMKVPEITFQGKRLDIWAVENHLRFPF